MNNSYTTLYRHVRRPEYILVSSCKEKKHGWLTWWGKLVHLSEEDLRTRGLEIVLQDLKEFAQRDSDDGAEMNGSTPEAKRARRKLGECWQVAITLWPDSKLDLQPMLDIGQGRAVGKREDRSSLQLPVLPDEFFRALSAAFNKCCVVEDH